MSTPNLQEAAIDRVLMERTETVVLVFDHTKWGIRALAHLAALDEVDVVVTDEGDNAREIAQLRQLGLGVLTVSSSQSEGADNHGRTAF